MEIIRTGNGSVECFYPEDTYVSHSISDNDNNTLTFEFKSGEKRSFASPKWFSSAYNVQFGISVSKDGERFFIQSWEKGLFCYSLKTGDLCWHFKRKHAWDMILDADKCVCFFTDWGAASISVLDGTLIDRYSLTTDSWFCKIVDETHMMLGPKRGTYTIIDMDLNELYRIPVSALNPSGFYNFIVKKAELHDAVLEISGIEQTADEMHKWWESTEKNSFRRLIQLDRFIVKT